MKNIKNQQNHFSNSNKDIFHNITICEMRDKHMVRLKQNNFLRMI